MFRILTAAIIFSALGSAFLGTFPANSAFAQATATPTPFLPVFQTTDSAEVSEPEHEYEPERGLEGNWQTEVYALEEFILHEAYNQSFVDPDLLEELVAAILVQETGSSLGCPEGPMTATCRGSWGEIGPMQVMPTNFRNGEDPFDLATNVHVAVQRVLLGYGYNITGGNLCLALKAYNKGGSWATNPEAQVYMQGVLANYQNAMGQPFPCP